jgi:carbonic anhydrase
VRNRSRILAWLGAAAIVVAAKSGAQSAPAGHSMWRTPWSYEGTRGAAHWGDLDPEYASCKTGTAQSPIDIEDTRKADLPPIRFAYKMGPLTIINNGYTAARVNYTRGNGNVMIVGDKRYELTQFHFHHPSEEYLHGKPYEMVIHLMHQASDGAVAGVAIPVRVGTANATVAQLWAHMPQTAGDEHLIPGVEIDPAGLLPRDAAYYTYEGSQTAPPCTEGVTWFVLKTPVTLSAEQIDTFAKLYPHDVRPIQPLNGRVVEESQ